MTTCTTIPCPRLVAVSEGYNQLTELQHKRGLLQAELIRACVAVLEKPSPNRWATNVERVKFWEERAQALLQLQWLATQLEREAGVHDHVLLGPQG